MTIKQQGGIFGRKPTFSKVDVEGSDASSFDRTGSLGKIVTFNDDGSEVGAIGTNGNVWFQGPSGTAGVEFANGAILPWRDGARANDAIALGSSSYKFDGGHFSDNLVMDSGKGIDFSATSDGSGTTTSELFDDYEEGSFSSSMTCGTSGTIPGTVNGTYVKIGQMVTCTGEGYVPTAPSSPTGNVQIALPFTSGTTGSGSGKRSAGSIIMHSVASANIADFHILTTENSATAYIQLGDATTRQDDSAQQFQQYTDFRFCVTYFTA